jgi:hypothetical protein
MTHDTQTSSATRPEHKAIIRDESNGPYTIIRTFE